MDEIEKAITNKMKKSAFAYAQSIGVTHIENAAQMFKTFKRWQSVAKASRAKSTDRTGGKKPKKRSDSEKILDDIEDVIYKNAGIDDGNIAVGYIFLFTVYLLGQ